MVSEICYICIGNIIDVHDEINVEGYSYPVMGMNKEKSFMPTLANINRINLCNYKVVKKSWFAFSGMQTGRDECIRIAHHQSEDPILISPAYTTFSLKDEFKNIISEDYLFMYFCRKESDRYGSFISDSSVRANLDWHRFGDIEIPLPNIEMQQRLLDVWKGLNDIKQDNDAQAEPLMNLCMGYLKKLKSEYPLSPIGKYIIPIDERNIDGLYDETQVRGIATNKKFIETKANMEGVSVASYKLVAPNRFAFVADTSRRGDKMSLAYNDSKETFLVSSISTVFRVKEREVLMPEYLYLWFLRSEFDRYARFHSWGSARETFNFDDMCRVHIPIPPKHIQQAIVDIYKCAKECKAIAEQADSLCKKAVPALIQKGAHS